MNDYNLSTAIPDAPPPERKRGGPPGNRHAQRHGLRSAELPKGAKYVKRSTDGLRMALEAATLAAKGEVSITDAATINTATRAETLARPAIELPVRSRQGERAAGPGNPGAGHCQEQRPAGRLPPTHRQSPGRAGRPPAAGITKNGD